MKETVKTSRTAGYLEKIFRTVNRDWFGEELEEPIITIQSTPRAYGHVSVAKTWRRKDDWRHELNLGAETLDRPLEHVVATMVHEMVHLYNIAHDVQDCSQGGSWKSTLGGGSKVGEGGVVGGGKEPRKSSIRKLVSPCCGQSVRATRAINILCGDCMEKMTEP